MTKSWAVILLVLSVAASISGETIQWIYSPAAVLGGDWWRLFTHPLVEDGALNLIIALVFLFIFIGNFERQWGSRDFLRFVVLTNLGAGVVGLGLHFAVQLLGTTEYGMGTSAVVYALFCNMLVTRPDAMINIFVAQVRLKSLVLVYVAWQVLAGIMDGHSSLTIMGGAFTMGYLLTTGRWRPSTWFGRKKPSGGKGDHLRIVPDKPTLH